MLESQVVSHSEVPDVPSLDTSFSAAQPVQIAVADNGSFSFDSPDGFFALMAGAPVQAIRTSTTEASAQLQVSVGNVQQESGDFVPRLDGNPAGIISLAVMAGLVLWRRIDSAVHYSRSAHGSTTRYV